MNSAYKHLVSLFSFFILLLVYTGICLAWDSAIQENIIVFDESGEAVASYHTGDWVSIAEVSGKITFESWGNGSPPSQISTDTTSISLAATEVAVPNFTSHGSTPPPATIPEVSLYSFSDALFPSTSPGDIPVLSVSHPSGQYLSTIELVITARSISGTVGIERKNEANVWEPIGDSSATVYISYDRTLTLRAFNGGVYSSEYVFTYSITQPVLVDTDGDGIPDIWEIAHGLNPLSTRGATTHNMVDSDGDGISDLDEILRGSNPLDTDSFPVDSDGDNWSDWDEEYLRGTDPNNPLDTPTATRLYEVESQLSGNFLGYNDDTVAQSDYRIETLQQRIVAEESSNSLGTYSAKIPMGSEAVIRVVDASNEGFIYKRYIPSVADPLFSEMDFDETDCTGDISTWHEQWQDALVIFLAERLVISTPDFDVTTDSMLPVAFLERQLEILSESVPADILDDMAILHPDLNSLPWLALASHGHRPENLVVFMLEQLLKKKKVVTWGIAGQQTTRSINSLMVDLEILALSLCHSLQNDIEAFYSVMTPGEFIEEEVGRLLQEQEGSYLAGLLLLYTMDSLNSYPAALCSLLSPDTDTDSDGLLNHEETPLQNLISGLADPFTSDSDQDGWLDSQDNCPLVSNSDQKDWDQDGLGDVCDSDDDNDGLSDAVEMSFGSNPYATDTNNDGFNDNQKWLTGEDPGVSVFLTDYKSPTNLSNQAITGYREAGSDVLVSINNGASTGIVSFPSPTSWQCELDNMIIEGNYLLSVTGSDPTDPNRSGFADYTLAVDLSMPVVNIIAPEDGSFTTEYDPLLEITVSEGRYKVLLNDSVIQIVSGQRFAALTVGTYQLEIRVTDLAGNESSQQISFTVPDLPTGDIDGNDIVDLTDLILVVQIMTGQEVHVPLSERYIPGYNDLWGMKEAILILEHISNGE